MSRDVLIVATGVANTRSVIEAFGALGVACRIADNASDLSSADHVVLPGVGSFQAGALAIEGLRQSIVNRIGRGMPTLGICLGYQLFFESSEESIEASGLGVLPGTLAKFEEGVRIPQMGWNRVDAPDCRLLGSGYAYFANSYVAKEPPEGWLTATATYGGPFVAGIERGYVVGCQFHPELSGDYGLGILERWLQC